MKYCMLKYYGQLRISQDGNKLWQQVFVQFCLDLMNGVVSSRLVSLKYICDALRNLVPSLHN